MISAQQKMLIWKGSQAFLDRCQDERVCRNLFSEFSCYQCWGRKQEKQNWREGDIGSNAFICIETSANHGRPSDAKGVPFIAAPSFRQNLSLCTIGLSNEVSTMSQWQRIDCNAGDVGSLPGLGRSPWEGNDNPPQCSCLRNPVDREPWELQSIFSKNQTWLHD